MWARIEHATVAEVTEIDPQDRFPPSLIWVACPHDTQSGMDYVNGQFTRPPEPPVDAVAKIAAIRYRHETAGIVVNGVHIDTSRESQALITAATLSAVIDPMYTCTWKAICGPVELSAEQLIHLATAVRTHVQASFDRECTLLRALTEGSYTPEMLEQGWPSEKGT